MGICQRNIGDIDKARVCLELAGRFLGPEEVVERQTLLKEIDGLRDPVLPSKETDTKTRKRELT